MRLPVCNFDLESDMLCPNCQARLDRGEISQFDIEFSKLMLEKEKEYPSLNGISLLRAVKVDNRLILVVKRKNKEVLLSENQLIQELREQFGDLIVVEGPVKLRTVVREFIYPAIEVGVNNLYSPDGTRESIVMLREEDKERIGFNKDELRHIISAIMGESVLFEYQDARRQHVVEDESSDEFEQRLKGLGGPHTR
jgi:hypothetical protein